MIMRLIAACVASLLPALALGAGSASAQPITTILDGRFEIASDLVWNQGGLYLLGFESHNVLERRRPGGWIEIATLLHGLDHPGAMAFGPDGTLYIGQSAWTVLRRDPGGTFESLDFGISGSSLYGGDIGVDSAGDVYLTLFDTLTREGRVRKRSSGGALTDIITGDGLGGHSLVDAYAVALDASGDAIVVGQHSDNAFRVTPAGVTTQIVDASGDGAGNALAGPVHAAADASGNFYVVGGGSVNAFRVTPAGVVTEILDAAGDGMGNALTGALGIAAGPSGNVYVRGRDNAFQITPGGAVTLILDANGDGLGNTFESSVGPGGIAVDGSGNVFVAGFASDNVFRIAPGGAITEIIDATGDGLGNTLRGPRQLATDAAGNVYVACWYSRNIFRVTPGAVITEWMDTPSGSAAIFRPLGIVSDAAGTLLVSTAFSPFRIYEVSPSGVESVHFDGDVAGLSYLQFVAGESIAVRASGEALVPGTSGNSVLEIDTLGAFSDLIDVTGDGTGKPFVFPTSLEVDDEDNLYVTAGGSHNAFRITPSGGISEIISAIGDGAGHTLRYPIALDLDGSGAVYIVGASSENVFKVAPGGPAVEILDASGDGQGNEITFPIDIAVTGDGDAFVLGTESHNVIHVAPDGTKRQIIKGGEGGPGDLLFWPSGVVVDTNGADVYVADEYRVFRISSEELPALGSALLGVLCVVMGMCGLRLLARTR